MRKRGKRPVFPIYMFIAVWLISSFTLPLYSLFYLIAALLASLFAAVAAGAIIGSFKRKNESEPEPEPAPSQKKAETPAKSYGPEVDAIIADGKKAMKEMGRLYSSIKNNEIRKKINELMRISDKIVQDAIQDPSDVPQIRKFLNYYLPTTIKLLNAYDRMSDIGIDGENLNKSMTGIEDMLDT
ncbi:MAG: hypothetical protein EOM14_17290, partial [Clostridia bacterium]|nr:hypothetical protein [Clostridia bacterium]